MESFIVKDLNPGSSSSSPFNLINVNGTLYFLANGNASTNRAELWKSDATAAGTTLVKNISPSFWDGNINNLIDVNGTLYFRDSDYNGTELWKSDGTAAGTTLVRDIFAGVGSSRFGGPNSSNPFNLTNVNGTLYFTADSSYGWELWKSDGTAAGTTLVKDINPGDGRSLPNNLTNVNGTLYFLADNGKRIDLWKSDGTAAGTTPVESIFATSGLYGHADLTNVGGTLYFAARNQNSSEIELWKSDGTPAGTTPVKNNDPESKGFSPSNLTNVGGTLYFAAYSLSLRSYEGNELWKSDGTTAGTTLVKDILVGSSSSDPSNLTNVSGTLYFTANDGINGTELWKSDGTTAGTTLVKNINPGSSSSDPQNLSNIDESLYFTANDGTNGTELWRFDTPSKNQNNAPFVVSAITNQTATEDVALNFQFDASTFSDYDVGDTLSYLATLENNNPLPSWLTFDAATRTFSGTPTYSNLGSLSIKVTATDSLGASISDIFRLGIIPKSNGDGLQAVYYDDLNFIAPTVTQINPTIDFNWGREAPAPGISVDTFSARWTGQVQAQYSERYTFYTQSDDGVRLWVNDQLLIDNWTDHGLTENSGTISLVAGQKYNIRMEFYDNAVDATAKLLWSSPTTPKAVIPQAQLYSNSGDGLKAVYHNNSNFTGPSVTQINPTVDFNWVQEAPTPEIEADTFSVRWTGQVQALHSEDYTFYTQSDDGVRLWVNDKLLIDNWTNHGLTENSGTIALQAGQKYNIRMEFYDNAVDATAKLLWSSPTTPKAVIPQTQLYSNSGDGLQTVYYDNSDLTGPSVTRTDSTIDFAWGQEAPAPGIEADTFSARWTGQVEAQFSELYTFYTQGDDGVRLWVNDKLLIDNWTDPELTEKNGTISLVAGQKYNLKMEFYDNAVDATAKLLWSSPSTVKAVIPQTQLYSNPVQSQPGDGLQAAYYNYSDFTGAAVTQKDPSIDFNWGFGSPAPGIKTETFSARWTGQVQAQASELYTFYTQSDDGVRLWVNDKLLIDNWTNHKLTEDSGTIALQAGQKYNLKMEFYDNIGSATAKLLWSSASTPKAVIPQAQLFSSSGNSLQAASSNSLNSASNTAFAASAIPSSSNGGQTDVLLGNQVTKANNIQPVNGTSLAQSDTTTLEPDLTWSIGGSSNSSSQTGIQQDSLATGVTDLWSMNGPASNSGAATVPVPDPNWQIGV